MEPSVSDELIVASVQQGSKDDYKEIVERYRERLLRYVIYICKDPELANDIVQNTFIKAYINIQGFNLRRKFSSWIYRIAHNEAINEVKKRGRMINVDIADLNLEDTSFAQITDILDEGIGRKQLMSEVAALPLKYREPLILHYFEGYSYQEISDMLRLPSSTVGVHITRAKQKLRTALSQGENNG